MPRWVNIVSIMAKHSAGFHSHLSDESLIFSPSVAVNLFAEGILWHFGIFGFSQWWFALAGSAFIGLESKVFMSFNRRYKSHCYTPVPSAEIRASAGSNSCSDYVSTLLFWQLKFCFPQVPFQLFQVSTLKID